MSTFQNLLRHLTVLEFLKNHLKRQYERIGQIRLQGRDCSFRENYSLEVEVVLITCYRIHKYDGRKRQVSRVGEGRA